MRKLRIPEDIQKLDHYVKGVNPKYTPLKRIITYYYIGPFEINCGLSGCGKSHMEGCLVELENGDVTNIGHVCGAKFGARFEEEKRKYGEAKYKPELIRKIADQQSKLNLIQFNLAEQKHRSEDLVRRWENFGSMFPELRQELFRRALNNRDKVFKSVELAKEEIDDLMAANPFQSREELRFKEVLVGVIRGFKFPAIDWSINGGQRKLFREIEAFADLTPQSMRMRDLFRWSNWCEDLPGVIAALESSLREGDEFFSQYNFELFELIPGKSDTRNKLKTLTVSVLDRFNPREQILNVQPAGARTKAQVPPIKPKISVKETRRLTGNKKWR